MHVHLVSNLFVDDILAIEHTVETMKDGSFVVWVIDIHFSNKVVTCFLRKGDMPGSESPSEDSRSLSSNCIIFSLQVGAPLL